jgi:hypothetical protein
MFDPFIASLLYILTTVAFFVYYYKLIIMPTVKDPTKKISKMKTIFFYVAYFAAIIGIQLESNISAYNNKCAGQGFEKFLEIFGATIKANMIVFLPLILLLVAVKQLAYPFSYTFGSFFCGGDMMEFRKEIREQKVYDRWASKITTCIDIIDTLPGEFHKEFIEGKAGEDQNTNKIYQILCRIVMSKRIVANCVWFILVGIYAIMKSRFLTMRIECNGATQVIQPDPPVDQPPAETLNT